MPGITVADFWLQLQHSCGKKEVLRFTAVLVGTRNKNQCHPPKSSGLPAVWVNYNEVATTWTIPEMAQTISGCYHSHQCHSARSMVFPQRDIGWGSMMWWRWLPLVIPTALPLPHFEALDRWWRGATASMEGTVVWCNIAWGQVVAISLYHFFLTKSEKTNSFWTLAGFC